LGFWEEDEISYDQMGGDG
jgi:hypothetical protein